MTSAQSVQQHQAELIKVFKCPTSLLSSALPEHELASLVVLIVSRCPSVDQQDVSLGQTLLVSSVSSE